MFGVAVVRNHKLAESRDQRSSSLESAPKFSKCSHFWRRGDNHELCQQCRFNEGGHQRDAMCAKHGCQKTGTFMRRQVAEVEEEGGLGG